MGPALEELRKRLGEHGYAEEIINNIIKQIEPFVGGIAPLRSNPYRRTLLTAGNS